ncbi:MAG: histidine phosphatase family protein [Actinomycetota bacterium]|nr:histidine phosphatase family protein [Actinomycetota bacterium]
MASTEAGSGARARQLFLVRHGETERSARHVYSGQADVPLTDAGREQARLAGERLADAGIDAIWSSPLCRATDTAEAIAKTTGAPVRIDERLIEVDYGALEGFDRHEAREHFGAPFNAWRADPFNSPLPGMEPLGDALARARSATSDAIAACECPLLVGHQGILRLVLVALGRVEAGDYFSVRLSEAQPMEIPQPSVVQA